MRTVLKILAAFLCSNNNYLENIIEKDAIHSLNKKYAVSNQYVRSLWRRLMFYSRTEKKRYTWRLIRRQVLWLWLNSDPRNRGPQWAEQPSKGHTAGYTRSLRCWLPDFLIVPKQDFVPVSDGHFS